MKMDLLFSSFPFISCSQVTLTRITELDASFLWEIMGDEETYRFLPTAALRSPAEAAGKVRQAETLFRDKRAIILGIFSNDSLNRLLGLLELTDIDPQTEAVTVSVLLNPAYTSMGFATSALRATVKYLFESVGAHRIQAYVLPINYRGVLVLERCGFVKEGTIRDGFFWPDKGIVDLTLYSLLPSDLKKTSGKTEQTYYI